MALTWEAAREMAAQAAPVAGWQRGALADKYVVPPFSILNTMSADWQDRKRFWLAMGIQSELGRGEGAVGGAVSAETAQGAGGGFAEQMLRAKSGRGAARSFSTDLMHPDEGAAYEYGRRAADRRAGNVTQAPLLPEYAASMGLENMAPGTSIFDPVLCEIAYRWWAPDGGVVLDPFAGGSVRGIVAGYMGHPYVGIDLSGRQIEANREQAQRIIRAANKPMPAWHVGDSLQVLPTLDVAADMVFTCPPYYDLEVYSDDPADISNMPWEQFLAAYRGIIDLACQRLAYDRFAVIVVGEVRDRRDPNGAYVGFVPATIDAFTRAGMRYYNEAILVNAAGSLPVRTGHQFEATRKIGKQHQNVLVFVKGRVVSRGWSVDRTPPPSPQGSLEDLIDQPTPMQALTDQVRAAMAAGTCPCPMPDHPTGHGHEVTNGGTAWGCVPHDHPADAPVAVAQAAAAQPAAPTPDPVPVGAAGVDDQQRPSSAVASAPTPRKRRKAADDGQMYGPDGGPKPIDDPAQAIVDYQAGLRERMAPDQYWQAMGDGRRVAPTTGEVDDPGTIVRTADQPLIDKAQRDAKAVARYHSRGKSSDRYGADRRAMGDDVRLASRLAELIVGEALGLRVADVVTRGALPSIVDVGVDVQVRWTRMRSAALITHARDSDDHRFVLVTGSPPTMTLEGWAYGREAKAAEFWREPPDVPDAAYFMPRDRLRPMSTWDYGQAVPVPPRAAVVPAGLAIGRDVTDTAGWGCTGCGGPPDGPLRTTVQEEIRRGYCPACDRDKPFLR